MKHHACVLEALHHEWGRSEVMGVERMRRTAMRMSEWPGPSETAAVGGNNGTGPKLCAGDAKRHIDAMDGSQWSSGYRTCQAFETAWIRLQMQQSPSVQVEILRNCEAYLLEQEMRQG